ncbi:MAG TPA: hypothetical protein VNZ03_12530 [Terriglobales bacterium]|nr:hypothetical protein [Terriglobales bacterium]
MTHFSEQVWADFVRGVGASETAQEVKEHLGSSCPECETTLAVWGRIAQLAARESAYATPENLVRLVKLQFADQQSSQREAGLIGSMIFDSATQPLPMGVRSGSASTRQIVYEAEGLTVDLRLERKPHSSTFSAAGQVLDKDAPLSWLGNAAIVLWNDKGHMLMKTVANDYGEFQFEFEHEDQLRISIITANRKTLRIALGNLE